MLVLLLALTLLGAGARVCDVKKDFGAKGDGVALDTLAINAAIADTRCSVVVLADGIFLSGSVRILRSHVELRVEKGAALRGAPMGIDAYDHWVANPYSEWQDWGHNHWRCALLYAINVTDVRITGGGSIAGNEATHEEGPIPQGDADKLIALQSCERVEISQLFLGTRNTGHFALLATYVRHLTLRDLIVRPKRDGFDIVSCQHVLVERCDIQQGGDDALVFKSDFSLGRVIDTFDVHVKDSVSGSNGTTGLELGSESVGDFYDYLFENHVVTGGGDAGIGMAIMDGGRVSRIKYVNISISRVASPVQFYIGARGSHPPGVGRKSGSIKDVELIDIQATHCLDPVRQRNWTFSLDGQAPCNPIGPNIRFKDVSFKPCSVGGGEPIGNPPVVPPHLPLHWFKIGPRPSWGLFARMVVGIHFESLELGFSASDKRPAVYMQDAADVFFSHSTAMERGPGVTYDIAAGPNVSNIQAASLKIKRV